MRNRPPNRIFCKKTNTTEKFIAGIFLHFTDWRQIVSQMARCSLKGGWPWMPIHAARSVISWGKKGRKEGRKEWWRLLLKYRLLNWRGHSVQTATGLQFSTSDLTTCEAKDVTHEGPEARKFLKSLAKRGGMEWREFHSIVLPSPPIWSRR